MVKTDEIVGLDQAADEMIKTCRHCGFEAAVHRALEGGVLLCVPIAQGSRSFVAGPTYEQLREALVMMTDRARHEGWCDRKHGHDCNCGLADDKAKVEALLGRS